MGNHNDSELQEIWKRLADLVDSLPPKESSLYRVGFTTLMHDLRQSLGNISSAEALLRRDVPATPENLELLDIIRSASRRSLDLVNDLAQSFYKDNTPPGNPE